MKIGYFLASEEWGPQQLVAQAVKARAAGFSEHLTKPINFERLEEAIQNLLKPISQS